MRRICRRLLDIGIALAMVGTGAVFTAKDASAQNQFRAYSAKFVCGVRGNDIGVVKGLYETSVNIHNPHFSPIQFQKKAVIALPQRAEPGPISALVPETLQPDGALGVDCTDIRKLFSPAPAGFIEGFLVIYLPTSAIELDVVGVYTARDRSGTPSDVDTIAVERVPSLVVSPPPS